MACDKCTNPACEYVDHGNGPSDERWVALQRLAADSERLELDRQRLAHQRAILRREVRRLNAKVAAMSATIYWRLGAGKQLSHEVDRRLLDGPAMWALRQALGLEACEVSNADVIRAAARRLGKREEK